jgi:hypothetical protein
MQGIKQFYSMSNQTKTTPERAQVGYSKPIFQQFNELINSSPQLAANITKEVLDRIEADNLPQNAFKVSKYGIKILYRNPDGTPYKYQSKKIERINNGRKSNYNTENEYQFARYRIAPSLIELSSFEGKYYSPSKHETGIIGGLPFFTDAAIQAYKTRKKGGTIYFVEGEIKAAVMALHGLESIGFGGISMFTLSLMLIEYLMQRQPDKIVLVYDADYSKQGKKIGYARPVQFLDSAAGFFIAVKQLLEYNQKQLPEFSICVGKDEEAGKGVDDVLKQYPDMAINALKSLHSNLLFRIEHIPSNLILPSCRAFFNIMADSRKYSDRVFQGNAGEYLTGVAYRYNLHWLQFLNKVIISPTGSGKSTLIRSIAAHDRIIVAVPTNALQKDFEREAGKNGIDCFLFNSDTYKDKINATGTPVSDARFIVTTYHSFGVLADVLNTECSNYNLIIDEAHNFTSSADPDFIYDHLALMLHSFRKFKSYTLFTATDLPVFASELQLEKWVFDIPSNIEKQLQFYEKGECQYSTAAQMAAHVAKKGFLPLIVLNSKKDRLIKLKRALKNNKIGYHAFNADTKKEPHHSQLLSTGGTDAPVMISTNVIKEGVSIYDSREDVVLIALSELHAAELEQFAARFRLAKSVTIVILLDSDKVNFKYSFSFANYANIGHKSALAHCEYHNQHELQEREFLGKYSEKFTSGDTAVIFNNFTFEWQFCPLLLANNVFRTESKRQRVNPLLMLQYLEKYGWNCAGVEYEEGRPVSVLIRSIDVIVHSAQSSEEAKTTKEIFMEALEALAKSSDPINTAETGENEFFSLYLATVEAVPTPEQALELFRSTDGSTTEINTLKRRLGFKNDLLELATRKKTKGTDHAKQLLVIINAFISTAETGGLTAANVRELYLATLAGTPFFENRDLQTMRNDRILKNLTRFLEYDIEKEKRNGKTEKIYYFSIVEWL